MEQPLDHFDSSLASKKWMMKYMVNDKYYKKGGPAFIEMGGEGPLNDGFIQTGELIQLLIE